MRKANAAAVRLSTCPAKLVSWVRSSCTAITKVLHCPVILVLKSLGLALVSQVVTVMKHFIGNNQETLRDLAARGLRG